MFPSGGADDRTVPTHNVVAREEHSVRSRETKVIARVTGCMQDGKTGDDLSVLQIPVRSKCIVRERPRDINRRLCPFAEGWGGSEMIRMVVCEQNPGWFGPQTFDDCLEMCTVFCWAGVDYEPTISRINDVAICSMIGHLSGIVRSDPQNSMGNLDSRRAARLRL